MTVSRSRRPIMLGVVGDSAAGKTTLTAGIARTLGADRCSVICTDDYHRYDRKQRAELGITPLHPQCNYLDILSQHLLLLRWGEPILKPVYDHRTGSFAAPVYVEPREFVIAEGLHGLSSPALRHAFDVRIYLDPPEDLRRRWKVKRDTAKRGYTPEQVLAELEKREPDSRDHIRPQRQHADIAIRFQPPRHIEAADLTDDTHLDAHLVLRASLPHPDLTAVVAGGPRGSSSMRLTMGRDDGQLAEFLDIAGNARDEDVLDLERHIQDQLGRIGVPDPTSIGVVPDGQATHHSHPLALAQLLVAYHLLRMRHTPVETTIEEQRRSADGAGYIQVDDTAFVLE